MGASLAAMTIHREIHMPKSPVSFSGYRPASAVWDARQRRSVYSRRPRHKIQSCSKRGLGDACPSHSLRQSVQISPACCFRGASAIQQRPVTYRAKSLKSWRARRDSNTRPLPSEGNDMQLVCEDDFLVGHFTICASDDREPFPIGIFVSSLAKVGIAFKARPCPVTGHAPYLGDGEARFEQSRNAIMAQVMEM